jgi:threonine/homoserine/homoserine lactone efflux protein
VETVVLAGYSLATISARSVFAGPPYLGRIIDAIAGGFFIAIGFLAWGQKRRRLGE